jgi:hypothetical protein
MVADQQASQLVVVARLTISYHDVVLAHTIISPPARSSSSPQSAASMP